MQSIMLEMSHVPSYAKLVRFSIVLNATALFHAEIRLNVLVEPSFSPANSDVASMRGTVDFKFPLMSATEPPRGHSHLPIALSLCDASLLDV